MLSINLVNSAVRQFHDFFYKLEENMEDKYVIIILFAVIVVLALCVGTLLQQSAQGQSDVQSSSAEDVDVHKSTSSPDTIRMALPEFDTKITKTVGEYTVEAEKWEGTSVGGFGVWLYKNGQLVDKDSYLSRAYFYMDGEWKWSEWGNGQGANYHKYPVGKGVEIQEIEVKF